MKKTFIILADGFEEIEAVTVVDVLRRLNIVCDICALDNIEVKGAHNMTIVADKLFDEMDFNKYDALILPGGMPGASNLKQDKRVVSLVKEYFKIIKIVAAICAAPIVLEEAGIIKNKRITSFPGFENEFNTSIYLEDKVVTDGNIITSRGPATAFDFAFEIASKIIDPASVDKARNAMLLD